MINSYAQTWCLELPATLEEIEVCNRGIARAFAPILNQYSNPEEANSLEGNCDRILKVNYDVNSGGSNNWIATDNWDNLVNVGDPLFSQYDIRPHTYYAVTWSSEAWIIVYSFYYARDWANDGIGCTEDEHEGDMAKVFVVVKRPDSENQPPEELLLGFKTTITKPDQESTACPTESGVTVIKPFHNSMTALGAHPHVWSASGSHHYYLRPVNAEWDADHSTWNEQCVVHGSKLISYTPPADDSDITTTLTPFSAIPYPKAYYNLIDIFDVDEGLWAQRSTTTLFNQSEPLAAQHFLCDSGEGCLNEPDIGPDGTPWAPWSGSWGLNPLEEILANGFNEFNCECSNSLDGCEGGTITECIYEFNPYLCEFYDIVMPGQFQYNGIWEYNPHQDNNDLVVAFRFSALDVPANAEVTWCWELPAGFNNTVTCVGCTQTPVNNCVKQGNSIVLKIANASIEDLTINPEDFKVTATADFIECGTVEREFTMQVQLKHIINTDTANCEKMVFEVKEAWHIDGNVYDWDFPLYDALATISNGGRRVEFNTESVIQQTSETTNPERKLEYNLTVTNPSYTSEIEVNGEREIPVCNYGGLGLMVYPNPATNDIYLEFEGAQPDESLDIQIFDHQFNRVGRESYFLKGQNIDVSGLGNGLYFLCAVTNEGKMLTTKFCVGRH